MWTSPLSSLASSYLLTRYSACFCQIVLTTKRSDAVSIQSITDLTITLKIRHIFACTIRVARYICICIYRERGGKRVTKTSIHFDYLFLEYKYRLKCSSCNFESHRCWQCALPAVTYFLEVLNFCNHPQHISYFTFHSVHYFALQSIDIVPRWIP